MVYKRKTNFGYLRKILEGGGFWMNSVRLTAPDIVRFTNQMIPTERTTQYLCLSVSISNMLAETYPSNAHVVRAFLQLLEEYEYHFAGTTFQSMKYMLAKNSPTMFPVAPAVLAIPPSTLQNGSVSLGDRGGIGVSAFAGLADDEPSPADTPDTNHNNTTANTTANAGPPKARHGGPSIHKFDSAVVYEHLVTSHVPFELDHVEVFVSLCEGEWLQSVL
jgi:hypothetical protein